jgi:hypothetical protein
MNCFCFQTLKMRQVFGQGCMMHVDISGRPAQLAKSLVCYDAHCHERQGKRKSMLSRIAKRLSENLPILSQMEEETCAKSKSPIFAQVTENTTKIVVLS